MKGVVVIPSSSTGCAVIQRTDGAFVVVKLFDGDRIGFLDVVELGGIDLDSKMNVKNLTTEAMLEVNVLRINSDLSWEEKMTSWGKKEK
jgi:hypothetical protein